MFDDTQKENDTTTENSSPEKEFINVTENFKIEKKDSYTSEEVTTIIDQYNQKYSVKNNLIDEALEYVPKEQRKMTKTMLSAIKNKDELKNVVKHLKENAPSYQANEPPIINQIDYKKIAEVNRIESEKVSKQKELDKKNEKEDKIYNGDPKDTAIYWNENPNEFSIDKFIKYKLNKKD